MPQVDLCTFYALLSCLSTLCDQDCKTVCETNCLCAIAGLDSLCHASLSYQEVVEQALAYLQAQLRVVKEESKETEERLLRQLKEVQADRNTCLEAACRADNLLSRFGDDRLLGTDSGKASSPREKARAMEDLQARLVACTKDRSHVSRATTALDGITAAGTTMKLKGREARSGATQTSPTASTASGRFAQLFQDIHALEHPHSL